MVSIGDYCILGVSLVISYSVVSLCRAYSSAYKCQGDKAEACTNAVDRSLD